MSLQWACRFCDIAGGKFNFGEIDWPLWYANSFMTVASIGAMVDGWSLIIPTAHQFSMSNLYADLEFRDYTTEVVSKLHEKFGRLIMFEHGSCSHGSLTGCGTDHAHLHILPLSMSLAPIMFKDISDWHGCKLRDICDHVTEREYLLYADVEDPTRWYDSTFFCHLLSDGKSQYFRRLIGACLGSIESSDYRNYPFLDRALNTHRIIAELGQLSH